ncbi:MAG TPA: R3H domain-containing nucleic acid-binding protein [Erysipelothrix sp.]
MKQYTARTLDDLLVQAAKEKDVEKTDLVYYITEEKTGFLGLGASVTAEVFAPQDVVAFIEQYFNSFFEGLGLEVEQNISIKGNQVTVDLNAENNAILIGRNGSSLNGLSNLLRNAVSSKFKRKFFVNLDINNYKQNRYDKLKHMAVRVAKNVQSSKVDAALDPMPNDERRIIHKELSTMENIKTQSEGRGRNRYLKIIYDENKN